MALGIKRSISKVSCLCFQYGVSWRVGERKVEGIGSLKGLAVFFFFATMGGDSDWTADTNVTAVMYLSDLLHEGGKAQAT